MEKGKKKREKISPGPTPGRRRRDDPRGSSGRPAPHRAALDGAWPALTFQGGKAHRRRPGARAHARPARGARLG
jgi:hypothetical protein